MDGEGDVDADRSSVLDRRIRCPFNNGRSVKDTQSEKRADDPTWSVTGRRAPIHVHLTAREPERAGWIGTGMPNVLNSVDDHEQWGRVDHFNVHARGRQKVMTATG